MKYRQILYIPALLLIFATGNMLAAAQGTQMSVEQTRKILDMTRANWVAFRDYNGRQLVYFTHLEAWKCGIESVRYGVNGAALNEEWVLSPCDPAKPNEVTKTRPYLSFPLDEVKTIAVQITYADGDQSDIQHFASQ